MDDQITSGESAVSIDLLIFPRSMIGSTARSHHRKWIVMAIRMRVS